MMGNNFHETYGHPDIKPPSDRSTGHVFVLVATIIAALWRNTLGVALPALAVGFGLAVATLIAPHVLRPLNILWFRLGLVLHRIVNPLVMLAIFVLAFLPAGLIMRRWHDPLRSHRAAEGVSTPERNCIGGSEQKSITAASKKAPDIGGLLAFAFQSDGVASGEASARGRRERRLEWARR
jgi:hypothetical protein